MVGVGRKVKNECFEKANYCCELCGKKGLTFQEFSLICKEPNVRHLWEKNCKCKITVDHFIPRIKYNGSNHISNFLALCASCNRKKSDKHPRDWIKEIPSKEIREYFEQKLKVAEEYYSFSQTNLDIEKFIYYFSRINVFKQ